MQTATTKTFSVNIPATYERVQIHWESIRGEHMNGEEYASFATIGLSDTAYYNRFKGADLIDKFKAGCLEQRGVIQVINDRTLQVAGLTSHIRTGKSDEGFFYYFGVLRISDDYCYNIIGDCYAVDAAVYEPLFDEIWQSLQYFGDPAKELAAQKAAIDALFADDDEEEAPEAITIAPFEVPENGAPIWELDGFSFQWTGDSIYAGENDGSLYVKLEAAMPDFSENTHGHILNDYEDGKVYLMFYFKGIYQNGIPIGTFRFINERDDTYRSYVWKGGFHYSLELDAAVTLKDGWIGINGRMGDYTINIAKQLTIDNIEWQHYHFINAEELESASPDIVRHIRLTDPYAPQLHQMLQPFTALETLSIFYTAGNNNAAGFTEVPKPIKKFRALNNLTLTNVSELDSLPQWLGDLKALTQLHVTGSKIEGIHPYILQLPALKYLYLSNNRLGGIAPGLPETLEVLTLEGNQLTTLPDSVTRLQRLNIKNNPLQQLPPGLEKIPLLELEMEKKIALLDYTYKGADGKGVVPYDDASMLATHDPALKQQLETTMTNLALQDYIPGMLKLARKAVAIDTTEEDKYKSVGNSRFGGLPDLPASIPYPFFDAGDGEQKALQFIAQLNCATISHLQDYLPRTGILYFFIKDQETLDPQVIYYNGENLQSASTLNITSEQLYDEAGLYTPYQVKFDKYPSIPFFYNARPYFGTAAPELEPLEEMYDETEALEAALPKPAHSINSYVFKQHDSPEIEAIHAKKGKPEEWMVLLRVSSDSLPGFNFWDAGEIYFVIHKSDLVQENFSNVYCGLESS